MKTKLSSNSGISRQEWYDETQRVLISINIFDKVNFLLCQSKKIISDHPLCIAKVYRNNNTKTRRVQPIITAHVCTTT